MYTTEKTTSGAKLRLICVLLISFLVSDLSPIKKNGPYPKINGEPATCISDKGRLIETII